MQNTFQMADYRHIQHFQKSTNICSIVVKLSPFYAMITNNGITIAILIMYKIVLSTTSPDGNVSRN